MPEPIVPPVTRKLYRYQLMVGLHEDENGLHSAKDPKTNIITTHLELDKKFGREKFRRLHTDEVAAPVASSTSDNNGDREALEGMTIKELQKYASGEEINLGDAKTKDEIIDTIIQAQVSV